MFKGFSQFTHHIDGQRICGVTGGRGPALLLIHGYPQTHVMWHKVAEQLAQDFTVVAADLRGYGRSGTPPTDTNHSPYSKRAMAADLAGLMTQLGHNRFSVLAHDRGARVAHRMGLDHVNRVKAMTLLDIAPTREMYANTDDAFARAYWHWFFLIQPAPFPENMIAADPMAYLRKKMGAGWGSDVNAFTEEAFADYVAHFTPEVIHASCEDYRAAATIDIEHDNEGDILTCPMQVLWGANGVIERCFDPLALWGERAIDVCGQSLPSGHYIAEEVPNDLLAACVPFLKETA